MVGIKHFKILVGIFIPFFAFFLMSQNTFAYVQLEWAPEGGTANRLNVSTAPVGSATTTGELYSALSQSNTFLLNSPWLYAPTWYQSVGSKSGNYLSVNADYWFAWRGNGTSYINSTRNFMTQSNLRCAVGDSLSSYDSTYAPQISNYSITWQGPYSVGSTSSSFYRVHVQYNYTQQLSSSRGPNVNVYCGWNRSPVNGLFYQGINLIEANKMAVAAQDFGTSANLYSSLSDALLNQQISQNQTIINQNQEIIDQNNAANDSISSQTPEDIDGATNNQTTSLINVITGFISAFSGINATNCNLTLEFPDFAGGSRTVDICSGKENAPEIVTIGSSLLLICVFVPLAYVVIRMIYNEIRSWTNG